jgi:hypothetical protein
LQLSVARHATDDAKRFAPQPNIAKAVALRVVVPAFCCAGRTIQPAITIVQPIREVEAQSFVVGIGDNAS